MEFSCHTLLNTMSLKQYKSLKFGGAPSVCIGLLGKASTKSIENSWFSEKAHADIEVLKKEFRELAKMYHPDVSGETQSTVIFKEISAEYDQIQGVLTNLS